MFRRQVVMLAILLFTGQLLVFCQSATNKVCSENSTGMQVSLTSQKNPSGIWITEVALERDGGRGMVDTTRNNLWALEVDSKTKTCQGSGSSLHVSLTIKSPLPTVQPDYELFPGLGFYKFHDIATTWPLARKICEDKGTHLIIVNSEKEADVAKNLFSRHPTITGATNGDYAWIGVERKDLKYRTIYGDDLTSSGFTRWDRGEPSKGSKDACLVISRATRGLHDYTCDVSLALICEQEI